MAANMYNRGIYDLMGGALWSGGDYGLEASLMTTAVVAALFCYLWRVPIRKQPAIDTILNPLFIAGNV